MFSCFKETYVSQNSYSFDIEFFHQIKIDFKAVDHPQRQKPLII